MTTPDQKYLFGGSHPWSTSDWTSSDDRVRGGSSISHLTPSPDKKSALFTGILDIHTLGGAGFASQRTKVEKTWDLSSFDGLELSLNAEKSDEKQYTLILKDEILPKRPDGRERSSISWEFDFKPSERVIVRWGDLKATYRGKEVRDVEPLNLRGVKRVSVMMRSFFGTQEGDFKLAINSIAGWNDEDGLEKRGGVAVETREDIDEDSIYGEEEQSWSQSGCCLIM
ncbi:CIA30 family protein [Aspergillus stella-maris]|uniref:CIA30 family protein n=1 Tax=Aspergillus stella-maris TaxID=1810926 RepID=UPI003CCD3D0C